MSNPFEVINSRLTNIEALLLDIKHEPVSEKQPHQSTDETDLLTPKETAQLLRISLPTLHRWQKKGKLKCYGIAGTRYYKRSEVIESLTLKK